MLGPSIRAEPLHQPWEVFLRISFLLVLKKNNLFFNSFKVTEKLQQSTQELPPADGSIGNILLRSLHQPLLRSSLPPSLCRRVPVVAVRFLNHLRAAGKHNAHDPDILPCVCPQNKDTPMTIQVTSDCLSETSNFYAKAAYFGFLF